MAIAADKEYRFADWVVIPSRRTLVQGGREVMPRAKVFDLLVYLLERRDRVVTREELLAELWNGRVTSENAVPQCVIELRKLLGDVARQPKYIQTAPKAGYRFVASVKEVGAGEEEPAAAVVAPASRKRIRLRALLWIVVPLTALAAIAAVVKLSGGAKSRPAFGEVAWWKLDGPGPSVADASAGGQSGTAGGDIEWVPGIAGNAAQFSGLGDGITGMGNGNLPDKATPRTISLWVKVARPFIDFAVLFEYGSLVRSQSLGRFGLYLNYEAQLAVGPTGIYNTLKAPDRMDDDQWHLVTATYGGPPENSASIYVDGALSARGVIRAPETDARSDWRIGRRLWGRATLRGAIDDVRVYNLALNAQQVRALYRCSAGVTDYGGYYFLPVGYPAVSISGKPGAADVVTNEGKDFTGIQLARSQSGCALAALHGADAGQNLRISMDLLVPTNAAGDITDGGPYFRSRRAWAGDGIIGGTSAGYWVQLYSTGMVKVKCLNPWDTIAFTQALPDFDSTRFHRLEVEARGDRLRVWLDSKLLEFEQGRERSSVVPIPAAWNGRPELGRNDGTAGVFFGAEANRQKIGGQQAKNIQLTRLD